MAVRFFVFTYLSHLRSKPRDLDRALHQFEKDYFSESKFRPLFASEDSRSLSRSMEHTVNLNEDASATLQVNLISNAPKGTGDGQSHLSSRSLPFRIDALQSVGNSNLILNSDDVPYSVLDIRSRFVNLNKLFEKWFKRATLQLLKANEDSAISEEEESEQKDDDEQEAVDNDGDERRR